LKTKFILTALFLFSFTSLFSYELFFSGGELVHFINQKLKTSTSVKVVSFSLDDTISENLSAINHQIFLEKDGGYSGDINLSIKYDKNTDGYLHQKYMIFDNNSVLFGTGNFTTSGLLTDLNIFIYTEDEKIVKVFLDEYENFQWGKFGYSKEVINQRLNTTEFGKVKIITGPSKEVLNSVLNEIKRSKISLKVFSYSFTDPYFVHVLEQASSNDVKVEILSDDWNKIYTSPLKYMQGINIKYRNDIHAKCITIDGETVIIGSYNLTYRAREKNDEMVVIIKNKGLADIINRKFDLLWQEW
jgi:phosphatidylserine/phosphatidylglycerophosphate/cardiolipin synthase-like enzyme